MSAGNLIGAVAGFFIGGPAGAMQGFSLGGMAQNILDPPKGPTTYSQGPRLTDLSQQTSTYGAAIPRDYGTNAVLGNVFWIENNAVKEVATTTSSSGGKGGGGSTAVQTTFAYYGTFAVGLCEGPIQGIRRVWIGPKLVYDAGANDIATAQASNDAAAFFKLYKGTDTQLADPRMQANLGVANTPAYRGLAYMVFYDMPLRDYGNSIAGAQVRVEVVCSGSATNSISQTASIATDSNSGSGLYSATAGNSLATAFFGSNYVKIYDLKPTSPRVVSTIYPAGHSNPHSVTYSPDGTILYVQWNGWAVGAYSVADGSSISMSTRLTTAQCSAAGFPYPPNTLVLGANANFTYAGDTVGSLVIYRNSTLEFISGVMISGAPNIVSILPISLGVIVVSQSSGIYSLDFNGMVLSVLSSIASNSACISGNLLCVGNSTQLQIFDISAFPVLTLISTSAIPSISISSFAIGILASSALNGNIQAISISNPASPIVIASTNIGSIFTWQTLCAGNFIYSNSQNSSGYLNHLNKYFLFLNIISPTGVTLDSIISAEMLKSSLLSAGDINTSLLTSTVRGFSVSATGSIRSAIEPLQGAFPFDIVQHGYTIKCVPRGTASVATVLIGELDARAGGNAPGVQLTRSREMDSMLPVRVSIKFLDYDREYNVGETAPAERLNTAAINIKSLDLPIVFNATEAAGKAEVLLYLYWMERFDVLLSLPPTYNQLEAADVITIDDNGTLHELRLTNINYTSGGWLECTAKYNKSSLYTPTALGESGLSTGGTLSAAGLTHYELLDIPLLLDSQDTPGFPVAMTGYQAGWPGGVLMRTDDGQDWTTIQGFSRPGTAMGYAGAALAAHDGHMIDKASVLTAILISGALYSTTEALMLGGANYFAYGIDTRWEIIAAQNCVLQGDGSYVLTDLLRGRNGTEWATGLHVAGDKLVALTASSIAFVSANLNQIGLSRTYRGITLGQTLDTDSDYSWVYRGVNLECLSPVELNGNRNPASNDWTLTWTRRTRIGGEWRDYVDAALGESTESYTIEIYSSATYLTLKRTLTSVTPTAAYTSAQQVTDFGGNQATLYLKIAQVSANVGAGYYLQQSITR